MISGSCSRHGRDEKFIFLFGPKPERKRPLEKSRCKWIRILEAWGGMLRMRPLG
jgi:hypothetical protein